MWASKTDAGGLGGGGYELEQERSYLERNAQQLVFRAPDYLVNRDRDRRNSGAVNLGSKKQLRSKENLLELKDEVKEEANANKGLVEDVSITDLLVPQQTQLPVSVHQKTNVITSKDEVQT